MRRYCSSYQSFLEPFKNRGFESKQCLKLVVSRKTLGTAVCVCLGLSRRHMPCVWRRALNLIFVELDNVARLCYLLLLQQSVANLFWLRFAVLPVNPYSSFVAWHARQFDEVVGFFAQLVWTAQTWDEKNLRSEFKVKKSFFL